MGERDRRNKCLKCTKPVAQADNAVQCEICVKWIHSRCLGWSDPEYEFVSKCPGFHWACVKCDDDDLFASFRDLRESHINLERRVGVLAEIASPEKIRAKSLAAAAEIVSDLPEREKRKRNVAITGFLPVPGKPDTTAVQNLCESEFSIKPTITTAKRVGKKTPQTLIITIPDNAERSQVLRGAASLRKPKNPAHSKVFISPDMTNLEQEQQFFLRQEVRLQRTQGVDNPVIFRGKVMPRAEKDKHLERRNRADEDGDGGE